MTSSKDNRSRCTNHGFCDKRYHHQIHALNLLVGLVCFLKQGSERFLVRVGKSIDDK